MLLSSLLLLLLLSSSFVVITLFSSTFSCSDQFVSVKGGGDNIEVGVKEDKGAAVVS